MPKKTPAKWLANLPPWDGKPRLTSWMHQYLGAASQDSAYIPIVSRMFLIGMVARALNPGVRFDYCIVLEGPAGMGKTEALRILAGKWFCNSDFDLRHRDAAETLQGKWLYEFADMKRITFAEANLQKSFLTRQFDEFRPMFASRTIRLAREVIFIGTTQESDPALDGRRFLTVRCSRIELARLKADRKQLFAEALAAYVAFPQILSDLSVEYTLATTASSENARSGVALCPHCRQTVNRQGEKQTLTDLLDDWVKAQTEPFSLDDAVNALGLSEEKITRDVRTRIGTALRRLGCKRTETKGSYSFTQDSQDSQPHAGPQSGPFEERSSPSIAPSDQPRHQYPTHQSDPVDPQPDGEHPVDLPSPKPTA